ncbi:PP2C family protein-serine/threonine phosphatase [Streptomyces sp. 1222.5]|uniref:PP2C family protein-serine/threonine phosphatase n=1 Tax=Streptomyces sp. 1222.5 TaxID=1881026 RepID=UPI003D70312B
MPEWVGSLRLSGQYVSSHTEARIGGDLYEALHTVHGIRFMIGDIRGKGLAAVEAAAMALGTFREAAHQEANLEKLVSRLEQSASRYIAQAPNPEYVEAFATAIFAEIPPNSAVLRMVNCGHPDPFLISGGGIRLLSPPRRHLPIGIADLVNEEWVTHTVPFKVGDRLLLYTDGISECRDADGTFYPLEERLDAWSSFSLDDLVQALHGDLLRYGNLQDDAALLAVERHEARPDGPIGR